MKHDKQLLETITLLSSPFAVLEVSIRDGASKIVEHAEDKSLFLDSEVCTKARNDLTNIRNRLSSEISWFPGVSPNKAANLLDALSRDIYLLKESTSLPPLARANVLAAVFQILSPESDADEWMNWILDFAFAVEKIDSHDVLREINADRSISGFPEVKGVDQIETELAERHRFYTETLKVALNKLSSMKLVEVVTDVVEHTTEGGKYHAPQLIHDLVDRYELEVNRYLEPEAENIMKLIDAIKLNAVNGELAIKPQIDKLDQVVRKWDSIAQPIQLSIKAQGLDHAISHDVAWAIRSLSIDLFNKYQMESTVKRLTKVLQELFAELSVVVEKLDEDANAIEEIIKGRQKDAEAEAAFAREISYQAEIGLVFKDMLKISPDGVEWKGRKIALDKIAWVRWGAIRKSVNGIPSGTDYTLALGDACNSGFDILTHRKEVYQSFTDCLWKAVCVRLLTEHLQELKAGKHLSVGRVSFDDNGINLTKHKLFGNENVYTKWGDVSYVSQNGSLIISSQNDKKTYVELPYLSTPNAHILEAMIRLSFKSWRGHLSGLLEK